MLANVLRTVFIVKVVPFAVGDIEGFVGSASNREATEVCCAVEAAEAEELGTEAGTGANGLAEEARVCPS